MGLDLCFGVPDLSTPGMKGCRIEERAHETARKSNHWDLLLWWGVKEALFA